MEAAKLIQFKSLLCAWVHWQNKTNDKMIRNYLNGSKMQNDEMKIVEELNQNGFDSETDDFTN